MLNLPQGKIRKQKLKGESRGGDRGRGTHCYCGIKRNPATSTYDGTVAVVVHVVWYAVRVVVDLKDDGRLGNRGRPEDVWPLNQALQPCGT